MPRSSPLHRHLEDLRSQLPLQLAEALMRGWLAQLRAPNVGQTPEENRRAAGWAVQLHGERSKAQATLAEAIGASMDACLAERRLLPEPLQRGPGDPLSITGLTLVDEVQSECDIEISRLSRHIEQAADAAWRELWLRVGRMPYDATSGLPLDLEHYPGAPMTLARGISQGVQRISGSHAERALLMRLAQGLSAELLSTHYRDALHTLQLPPPIGSAAPASAAPTPETLLHELLRRMLHDPRLPAVARNELGRLEAPLVKLLAQDPSLLSDNEHPAWLFLDELTIYAAELPEDQSQRRAALLDLVRRCLDAFEANPQRAILARGLTALRALVNHDGEQLALGQAPARQALLQAERERELLPLLQQQLGVQVAGAGSTVPRSVQRFLIETWSRVLARSMAAQGPDGAESQALLASVDSLLTSLRPPAHEAARQQVLQGLPQLLSTLQQGMALIELPASEREALLDTLMQAHRQLLFGGAREVPAPAAKPAEPAAATGDIVWDDSEYREQAADNWHAIDTSVGALPTVPMGFDAQAEAERLQRWLQALRPGMRCKLFLQGSWATARLTWRSDNGQFFMFASSLGSGSHTMTRRALERLRAEGLATEVGSSNLLERAMQGWLQDSRPMGL